MDALEILNHPAINKAEIARRLYPDLSGDNAKRKLAIKVSGAQNRRVLPEEEQRILQIWDEIQNEINGEERPRFTNDGVNPDWLMNGNGAN